MKFDKGIFKSVSLLYKKNKIKHQIVGKQMLKRSNYAKTSQQYLLILEKTYQKQKTIT